MNSCCHYHHVPIYAFTKIRASYPPSLFREFLDSPRQWVAVWARFLCKCPHLCAHPLLIRRVTVKFPRFLFPLFIISFLAAFSLLFFPPPSHYFFTSLSITLFSVPFTSFLHSFFPRVWKSLFLAWYWLPCIGTQNTTLCQEFNWSPWGTRVGEVYFQENAFSSSSSLHVACVCSIASTSVQEALSDFRTRPHVALCCMLKPQQMPGFLAAFILWHRIVSAGNATQERKWFWESLLAVTFFNYAQLHWTASLGFGLSRKCIEVAVQY